MISSRAELEKFSGEKVADLHKHFVDNLAWKCKRCDGKMQRIPEVLDCWFESGSMPYASRHFPFENKIKNSEFEFFKARTKKEIERCQQLRHQVFVKEQNIDEKLELDGKDFDENTRHFFAMKNEKIFGTVLRRETEERVWKVERLAISKEERR